ncbi:hypothetical protein LX36DRAFT_741265 [Colletotrichum falcatum]|nr:hypothetical protein LX36DRAFT_741265 [Colletotrichum falcatum]
MDPSSPAKRRALAPLDANVNAMSPTKILKHSKLPGSPRKSPIKTPLGLKRPLASVIFDENAVARKKQCQETPAATAPSASASATSNASALMPAHVSAVTAIASTPAAASEDTIASTSTPTSASTPAQTVMDMYPNTKEVSGLRLMDRVRNTLRDSELNSVCPWQDQSEQQEQQPEEEKLDDEPRQQRQLDKMQPREEQQTQRNPSASPDTSSVFDNSAMDISQENTMLTEPDAEQSARAQPPARPRRLLTREEARQKARILRLKLGLANYKLQTGQENLPLDRLEVKPRPGQQRETARQRALPRVTVQPPSSRDGPPEKDTEETMGADQREGEPEPVTDVERTTEPVEAEDTPLPRLVTDATGDTEDEDEPTNAVCDGVASSLLSLARASSSSVSSS